MRAVVLKEPGVLKLESVPDATPAPGEILLRVRDCGICGSDLHAAKFGIGMPPDSIMGHEFAGEIAALGDGVEDWKIGERVVSLPYMSCGTCEACRRGDGLRCGTMQSIGLGMLPGAYAELVRVHPGSCLRVPDAVGFREAALVEPLAVGLHGVRLGNVGPETACVVMGAGPIGAVTILWARHAGARAVVASDPSPGRRALATRLGAHAVVDPNASDPAAALQALAGVDPAVVFECVGVKGTINAAMLLAGVRGRVVVLGVCAETDEIFPMIGITKELELAFALAYSRAEFAEALEVLRSGAIDVAPLVTDVIDLADVPEAFRALERPRTQCKVLIEFA
jgi:(R,R)-butanediol dehydrogenase/meso-butanediol dehydrogenase/diacetyl reductase